MSTNEGTLRARAGSPGAAGSAKPVPILKRMAIMSCSWSSGALAVSAAYGDRIDFMMTAAACLLFILAWNLMQSPNVEAERPTNMIYKSNYGNRNNSINSIIPL